MSIDGERVAFLVAPEGLEQVGLTEPWKSVKEAGVLLEIRRRIRRTAARSVTSPG